MKTSLSSFLILFSFSLTFHAQDGKVYPSDIQINTAVLPAPEEERAAATVYGYDDSGEMVVLRRGTNNLICLSDDPSGEGINVACYSKKLEPFMKRGRELRKEGKGMAEIREIRKQEVEAGTLEMPDVPSMLYVLNGEEDNYNTTTGELSESFLRYVIYTPFATTESTGLPDKPHAPGMPWLMDPGTHRAHIMVTPEK